MRKRNIENARGRRRDFGKKMKKNRCHGIGDFTIQFAILSNLPSIFSIQFSLENLQRPGEHSFDKFLPFRALHRDLARIPIERSFRRYFTIDRRVLYDPGKCPDARERNYTWRCLQRFEYSSSRKIARERFRLAIRSFFR